MKNALTAVVGAVAAVGTVAGMTANAPAQGALRSVGSPALEASTIGTSEATAAGSCWEIKQVNPGASDGTYWVLTPAMTEPLQVYCDMTTNGGGWVLIAKGRDGWNDQYNGKGAQSALLTPQTSPMSSKTVQMPSPRIDGLLNNRPVSSLSEGVRLRRAVNTSGTLWQEVRFRLSNRDRWVWTLGAEHPISSSSFDGISGGAGITASFGTDSFYRHVSTGPIAEQGYHRGFAYGSGVRGSSASNTYLWSRRSGDGRALPYTMVYLRPRITSDDTGFTRIPDSGTAAISQPSVASSIADELPWHVSGLAGSTQLEGSVEVQAFTQSGNRMYVGGNFRYVQRAQNSSGSDRVEQPFLAAFNVNTGEFVTSFRPVLNEQVRALATLPDGRIVAGGEFTRANGRVATAVVALDPVTGDTAPDFSLRLENRLSAGVLRVRALSARGDHLYLGGAFTHLSGGSRPDRTVYARAGAEVSAVDGTPRTDWNPNLNGTVIDLDPSGDGQRVYMSGYFTASNGRPAENAAALQTSPDAPLATPLWRPTWSAEKSYQQGIEQVGSRVWVGGAEHAVFSFSTSSFDRLSGNIMRRGGDVQAVESGGGVVYASCHCNQLNYSNAFTWPNLQSGWTQADTIGWVGAWDASTGDVIPSFTPIMRSRLGSGVWAITSDSNGRVWVGGDLTTVRTRSAAARWSGGFTRFDLTDSTPPSAPTNLRVSATTASSATLDWNGSTDGAGPVGYQVLRDDRVIATTTATNITVPLGGENRFFVRAQDSAGNVSSSTAVATAAPSSGVDQSYIDRLSTWRWHYATEAPSPGWNARGFDAGAWAQGDAVLGFGAPTVATDIDNFPTTSDRARAAYFRKNFQVDDASAVSRLVLETVADDGAVVYVNGTEVARQRMPDGTITHTTFASDATRSTNAEPLVIDVPPSLLVTGQNTIAVETHLNYRNTADITFDLRATGTVE